MKATLLRDGLMSALSQVIGVVERRQTLPILAHVLVKIDEDVLTITATDLEVELVGFAFLPEKQASFSFTVPGRKFFDICKSLEGTQVDLSLENNQVLIKSNRSRFQLQTLAVSDFPVLEEEVAHVECQLTQQSLRDLIESSYFCMAQQDVRYYLNGVLLECSHQKLTTVATDGHRLALAWQALPQINSEFKVIVPRKGVVELLRLLDKPEQSLTLKLTSHHVTVSSQQFIFTSKLIDGRFPDYQRVLPKGGDKTILVDKFELQKALGRVSILSNEKYRGVSLELAENTLTLTANNPEQEEAQESLQVDYNLAPISMGFNVGYVQDVISAASGDKLRITLSNAQSGVLFEGEGNENALFVIMPMRL